MVIDLKVRCVCLRCFNVIYNLLYLWKGRRIVNLLSYGVINGDNKLIILDFFMIFLCYMLCEWFCWLKIEKIKFYDKNIVCVIWYLEI